MALIAFMHPYQLLYTSYYTPYIQLYTPFIQLNTPYIYYTPMHVIVQEGRCNATWKRGFKLPWRDAGPPNHHDDKVDSDQQIVKKELSLCIKPKTRAFRDAGEDMALITLLHPYKLLYTSYYIQYYTTILTILYYMYVLYLLYYTYYTKCQGYIPYIQLQTPFIQLNTTHIYYTPVQDAGEDMALIMFLHMARKKDFFFSLLLSSLELSDTQVYEP